ncbi:replication protein A 70 kDa DNA-binding subunit B [Tanacetum coccineum]|uniref:Replication protein A 70 kDa DNA-binding subunit B n=1 Tax=Tanacetum coccineum TaxID=301880 RepID=A0ABQ4Y224_9ASTR
MEIEGELRDEANVADSCKGAVSFDSAMFEKKNSQPLQKLMVGLTCPGWIGVDKSQLAQDIFHSTRWRWSGNGSNWCEETLSTIPLRVVDASNITMIKDVDLVLDNITVHGRCISLLHSHRMNQAHNMYSLDMVIQDSQGTVVTRINSFDNNVNGFILEPFNRLLDGTRQYHEHEAVDIIGSVVAIGDIVPVQSAAGRKIRRTVVVEDSKSNQLDCTFWDQWANMWDEYAVKRDELGHVVFILQLGKVKYWDGTPSIHNALFGTKMFINRDLPEILSFRQRLKELPEYDESRFKMSLFTPQKPMVTIADFFNGAVKKMVSSIRECDQKSHCIVYARIHRIHIENEWAYTACKECNKKVNVVESKAMSSAGKSKVTFYCEDRGAVQVASRYKVIMRINDQSGSAPIVFFNTMINKLSGYTAWELMEKHDMDVDEYWPGELLDLVGKRCDAVNDEPSFVKHFKEGFLDEEDDDEGFTTPASRIKVTNLGDDSANHVLDMQTPTSGNEAS